MFNDIAAYGPKTYWIGHARWVVDERIWTTSGVSAGIDGMVAFIASFLPEDVMDEVVNNGMEYHRQRDSSNDPFAELNGVQDISPVEK